MKLQIEYVPIDSIKPYERNAKLHPKEQVEQIKRSIEEFGFNDPLALWNGEIVEGHGRYFAALDLGLDKVPVIRLDELTDEQRRAYALVHNKLTMNSDFNLDLLNFELDDIDMDMEPFGFDDDGVSPDEYGEEFSLPEGDKAPIQNMTFTFSNEEAETVKTAIAEMKKMLAFKRYDNPLNENGNGKALFLVVSEWQARRK